MKWFNALFISALIILVPAFSFGTSKNPDKPRSDQEVRTIVRKKAPFWLQDGETSVQIKKDGNFGIDAAGGAVTVEGKWRVEKGQLKLVWNVDKREKAYSVSIENRAPIINGAPLKDGRFTLSGQSP